MDHLVTPVSLENLKKAFGVLERAIADAQNELEMMGAVHAFKFCYELSLKIMRSTLQTIGKSSLKNARSVFREAAANNLIDDEIKWSTIMKKRKLTYDTYKPAVLADIVEHLPIIRSEISKLIAKLETHS